MSESSVLLDKGLAQTTMYPLGLEVEKAEGIYIYTTDGKRYMDMVSGVGVSGLGHGNTYVNDALKKQIDKHLHVMVYGEFVQHSQYEAARLLTSLLPSELDCCY